MFPPFVVFNPMDPDQRRYVRTLLDAADVADAEITGPVPVQTPAPTDQATTQPAQAMTQPAQVIRKLPKLLRLSSGQLLALAVQHFGPGQPFDMKELAQKSGLDTDTMLSKNRTLAYSCKKRGLAKGWVLHEHGGWPKKFSIPASIHAEITRIMALPTGTPTQPVPATAATV